MDNRSKTTACKILQEMLMRPPGNKQEITTAGMGLTYNSDPHLNFSTKTTTTYHQDTNALIRAKLACEEGMVVSPLSNNKSGIFYTTPDRFNAELKKAQQRDEEKAQNWVTRFRNGFANNAK